MVFGVEDFGREVESVRSKEEEVGPELGVLDEQDNHGCG
jgi:hypothetical protein